MRKYIQYFVEEKNEKTLIGSNILSLVYCFAVSIVILFFISRSSPYYVLNNWDDANTFFSIGKAFIRGQVLYRDVVDQKGCYLYLIYGLASLISDHSFIGVWIAEIIAATFVLWFSLKILLLYQESFIPYFLCPVLLVCMYASRSFYWGGSAEEFCMPFITLSLYETLKAVFIIRSVNKQGAVSSSVSVYSNESIQDQRGLSEAAIDRAISPSAFIVGLCTGITGNIKFTLLGFHISFILLLFYTSFMYLFSTSEIRLVNRESRKRIGKFLIKQILLFVSGVIITIIPWLIYFRANNAIREWIHYYLTINIFGYSNLDHSIALADRINSLLHILYWQFRLNPGFFIPAALGIGISLLYGWPLRIFPLFSFVLSFLGIYIGGQDIPYYPLPLSIFAISFFIQLNCLFSHYNEFAKRVAWIVTVAMAIGSAAAVVLIIKTFSINLYFHQYDREDLFQFTFAKEIKSSGIKNPTLLNFDCLDQGLFTIADIYPSTPYFVSLNINDDEIKKQLNLITAGATDFVLCRDDIPREMYNKYKLICNMYQSTDLTDHEFYLFERL